MKTLNITFTDEEFKKLCKAKAHPLAPINWHAFIMTLSKGFSVKARLKDGE